MIPQRRRSAASNQEQRAEERQRVAQALLNRAFVHRRQDPELYLLAREHYPALRDWFHEQTGWSLLLTRQFAKLEKMPGVWQPWMVMSGLRDGRDYGYFTFGLWYLEGLGDGEQFLLSELVEAIREHLVVLDVSVNWTRYDHRLAMARALKKLRDLGALRVVDGDETDWARTGGEADVLYESSPLARYVLQRLPKDLAEYRSLDELAADEPLSDDNRGAFPGTDQGSLRGGGAPENLAVVRRRQRVMRRLLQEPVVYDWQWTEEERRYVQTQRASLIERVHQSTGLVGRRFREGLFFLWPELTSEMDLFPTLAVVSDIALLFAGQLRRRLASQPQRYERDERNCVLLTRSEAEGVMMEIRARYGEWWSKEYREKSTAELAVDLVEHLREWNLGWPDGAGGVRLFPAFLRWNGDYQWEAGEEG